MVEKDIRGYSKFNKSRQDFYNKLRELNGYTKGYYIDNNSEINICIDGVKLNITSRELKTYTYKSITNFKNNLSKNNDEFIKFTGLTNSGNLIARIKTYDSGVVDVDIGVYDRFVKARQDFYNKLKEVNGYITDYYKGKDKKINIFIDGLKLNPINPNNFKRQTYKIITDIKRELKKNGDKLIKFTNITNGGNLIAKIKTFDDGEVDIDISRYDSFEKGRKNTYKYCASKGYKILSPYVKDTEKLLIDFNCGHRPHWIKSGNLKQGYSCPICDESKGEKFVRQYLESNNIEFIQEYKFNDCKHKRSLPFDFYIKEHNLCIEFDGEQHYKSFDYFGGEEKLKITKIRDKIKNNYCKDNNINLIRIPYWEIDNIEKMLDREFKRLREIT